MMFYLYYYIFCTIKRKKHKSTHSVINSSYKKVLRRYYCNDIIYAWHARFYSSDMNFILGICKINIDIFYVQYCMKDYKYMSTLLFYNCK